MTAEQRSNYLGKGWKQAAQEMCCQASDDGGLDPCGETPGNR